ncbi:hypothetical protein A5670_17635 [Mycolicibacterium fortuitum]|nr:hypothetical protein A5670_17635 [Mycolicibacterium fortuitum]
MTQPGRPGPRPIIMLATDTIDAELLVPAAYQLACIADEVPVEATAVIDGLFDERLTIGHPANLR